MLNYTQMVGRHYDDDDADVDVDELHLLFQHFSLEFFFIVVVIVCDNKNQQY